MNPANRDYQLGLLHFIHVLVNVDGVVDDRERKVIQGIRGEENIPDSLYSEFEITVSRYTEQEIYYRGVELLNQCSEEEKLCAFVHLYRLAEADSLVHVKEVRFLLYGIKVTRIEFEDVVLSARLVQAQKAAA
jgi:hypothetical protein